VLLHSEQSFEEMIKVSKTFQMITSQMKMKDLRNLIKKWKLMMMDLKGMTSLLLLNTVISLVKFQWVKSLNKVDYKTF